MWKDANELIEYPKAGILSKEIFKSDGVEATLFCMAAGTEISKHTSTRAVVVVVLEGDGVFKLEGKPIKMSQGVLINLDKNAVHSLQAKKDTAFVLLLFNSK